MPRHLDQCVMAWLSPCNKNILTMFSLPQVISMALLEAAQRGNVQACWMHAVFALCFPYDPIRPSLSFRSLHSISLTAANQHNPPHSSVPSSKCPLISSVFRLIAASLDMLCPNFVSLIVYTRLHTASPSPTRHRHAPSRPKR